MRSTGPGRADQGVAVVRGDDVVLAAGQHQARARDRGQFASTASRPSNRLCERSERRGAVGGSTTPSFLMSEPMASMVSTPALDSWSSGLEDLGGRGLTSGIDEDEPGDVGALLGDEGSEPAAHGQADHRDAFAARGQFVVGRQRPRPTSRTTWSSTMSSTDVPWPGRRGAPRCSPSSRPRPGAASTGVAGESVQDEDAEGSPRGREGLTTGRDVVGHRRPDYRAARLGLSSRTRHRAQEERRDEPRRGDDRADLEGQVERREQRRPGCPAFATQGRRFGPAGLSRFLSWA